MAGFRREQCFQLIAQEHWLSGKPATPAGLEQSPTRRRAQARDVSALCGLALIV